MESRLQSLEERLTAVNTRPNAPVEDKIEAMIALGWEVRHVDPHRSHTLSRQAYDLAIETGYERGQVYALRNIMIINMRVFNQFDLAMAQASQALAIADKLGDEEVKSQILNVMQLCYKALGKFPEAVSTGLQNIELSRQTGNPMLEINALHDLAIIYGDANFMPPAIEMLLEVLKLAEGADFEQLRAIALANLGECYIKTGNYPQASHYLQQALPLARRLSMQAIESFALNNLGRAVFAGGDDAQALALFTQALALASTAAQKDLQAYILGNMGRLFLKTDADRAVETLTQALELALEVEEKQAIIECHQYLAEACEQQGHIAPALAHYKRYQTLKEEIFNETADQQLKILQVTHKTETAKREAEINRLKNVALEKEIAERKKAEESAKQQAEELAAPVEVGRDISATLDLTVMLEKIANRAKTALQASSIAIVLKNPQDDQTFRAIVAKGNNAADIENFVVKPGVGIAGNIIQTGVAEIVNSPNRDARTIHIPGTELMSEAIPEALMCVPLIVNDEVIGALTLWRELTVGPFTPSNLNYLTGLAQQAAIAIQNARPFQQEQKIQQDLFSKIEELSRLNHIMQTITRTVELDDSLRIVARALVQKLQVCYCGISLLNKAGTEIKLIANASLVEEPVTPMDRSFSVKNDPVVQEIINKQQTIIITRPQTNPLTAPHHAQIKASGIQYILIAPLLVRGKVIGAIGIDSDQPGRVLNADEIQFVETVAGQIAGVVHIATLFDREQRQRQVAESLQEVALVINSSLNLKIVIDKILEQLRRVLPCDSAGLFLLDNNALLLSGGFGFDKTLVGYRIPVDSDIITTQIFHNQTTLIIEDVYTSPTWDAASADPRIRSWMAAPLLAGEKTIGVLTADNFETGAYSLEDTQTLQIFATQASVAIENARLFKELEEAKEAAESANKAKTYFLSTMSHELRTPLNGILGYTQLLMREENLPPDQLESLGIIEQSGNHLLTLINDLLDLAKIEAGKLDLQKTEFNLPRLLKNVSEMIYVWTSAQQVTYRLETNQLPTMVQGDEKRLRQVLINLLGNAAKFTKAGQIVLKVTRQSAEPAETNTTIRFAVEDTGIGISPEDLAFIFEPFRQAKVANPAAKGTGLGLTVCRSLVGLMDGTLNVTSQPGQGSTFWFEISLPEVKSAGEVLPVRSKAPIIGVKGIAPSLLIVDDNTASRKMLSQLLSPLGFSVHEAASGASGLAKALAIHPDAIITDLIMPDMDGFELTRQIRQSPIGGDVIIIANSANAFEQIRQKSLEAGCNAFITKPIDMAELLELLENLLGIEYFFKEAETPTSLEEQLVCPPAQTLKELLESLLIGDIRATEQKIAQVEEADPRFNPFVAQIRRLTRNFKIDEAYQYLHSLLLAAE